MQIKEYIEKLNGPEAAEALSALCVLAKTKEGKAQIETALPDRLILRICTHAPEAKVRKNSYRLMGELGNPRDTVTLVSALERETTLFALPSLLLALGNVGAEEALRAHEVPVSQGESMDKHVAEIALARQKALQRFDKRERLPIASLTEPKKILCYAPKGFLFTLMGELKSLGFSPVEEREAAAVVTADIGRVYQADCLLEALIPIAENVAPEPQALALAVGAMPHTPYRMELRGYTKDRRKLIHSLTALLGGENNPSDYDWELRIDCRMDGADIYWKLCNVTDTRYPWRTGALPASIHPALAACLARYAMGLGKIGKPRVLDPFCGSGSLLFMREKAGPCKALIGVDKSSSAVELSRENARAGQSKASFVTKDILRFESREGFDLVLSNMPFGNRVGNHEGNKSLYKAFLYKLPKLLTPQGTAVLYTMEYKLLESCLKGIRGLKLREVKRTEAGGLLPWVFVIDRE